MGRFLPSIQSWRDLGRRIASAVVILPLLMSACMTYRVDSLLDAPDANPGDRTCARAVPPGTEAGAPGGLCTLRAAVMESNASVWKDTIEVPSGLYQLTLPVAAGGGHLAITDGVKIQGAGAATTIIDGDHAHIVFYVQSEGLELSHVTVQGGNSSGGGGIRIDAGTSEFNNLVFDRTRLLRVEADFMLLMVRRSQCGRVRLSTIPPPARLAEAFGIKVNCGCMTLRLLITIQIGLEGSAIQDR